MKEEGFESRFYERCREIQEPLENVQVESVIVKAQISEILVTFDPKKEKIFDESEETITVKLEWNPDLHQAARAEADLAIEELFKAFQEKGKKPIPLEKLGNTVRRFYFSYPLKDFKKDVVAILKDILAATTWDWIRWFSIEVKEITISCVVPGCKETWKAGPSTNVLNLAGKLVEHFKVHSIEDLLRQFAFIITHRVDDVIKRKVEKE